MFNKAPNKNGATCLTHNVHLTTMCTQKFSVAVIMQEKEDIWETRVNNTKITKLMRKEINFILEKNESHIPK